MTTQTHEFQAEVSQLLRLVVDSLYSQKEVFLRELVSNASDAIDKRRFEALTDKSLDGDGQDPVIRVIPDLDAKTLVIADTGIGMSQEELTRELGTIARSGSKAFLEAAAGGEGGLSLIGQFGVGFYSAFLVADTVDVISRRAGSEEAWKWSSDAKHSFTIESAERAESGTSVVLHLTEEQAGLLDEWRLRELIQRYSDFVSHPIELQVTREVNDESDETTEPKTETTFEVINKASAIWTRDESEVEEEQYHEFYKHLTHEWEVPLAYKRFKLEGTQMFTGLLFVPKKPPFDLYMRGQKHGVRLYVKRVFIMEDCEEFLPQWLRFVRGVIDSDDLPLNVSRELLQDSAVTRIIRKQVIKKTLDLLESMASDKPEDYAVFWEQFGAVLKEGLHFNPEFKERIGALARYNSSNGEGLTSLAEYKERMQEGQPAIYYITGDSAQAVANSPYLESLKKKGYEVIYMTDPVDDWALQELKEFDGVPLVSAARTNLALDETDEEKEAREKKSEELKSFTGAIRDVLGDKIQDVTLSTRLTESPCCLVTPEGALSAQLEQALRATGAAVPEVGRVLELNADHILITKLQALHDKGVEQEVFKGWIEVLHEQALLSEGRPIEDPNRFARRITDLLTDVVGNQVSA